jgi:hypothetical protein
MRRAGATVSNMTSNDISQPALDQIRDVVHEWAREWGEEDPQCIRAVRTTHDLAVRALYLGGVRSTDEETYLVVLEGAFSRPPSGSPRGVWAALFLTPSPRIEVRSYTVRPSSHVPALALEEFGAVGWVG